jgi:hypothetical protein
VNDELAQRYAEQLQATFGHAQGRMLSYSKSGYAKQWPLRLPLWNAIVCTNEAEIFHGDVDLSVDERKLAALSEQIGQIVYVLSEGEGRRAENESLPLDRAIFSVTPTGHTSFQSLFIERSREGVLQRRPPEPDTRPRWRWRVLVPSPRLWRFWRFEKCTTQGGHLRGQRNMLIYLGARDQGATPLLVLASYHGERGRGVEAIWYPTQHKPPRHAPRPLLSVQPIVKLGRLGLWCAIVVWPGYTWELRAGFKIRMRWL